MTLENNINKQKLKNEIIYKKIDHIFFNKIFFDTTEELSSLLNNNNKNFNNATLINYCFAGNTTFSFYTENFHFQYNIDTNDIDSPKFDYFCNNSKEFTKIIFKYVSKFTFDNFFILTDDEDEGENIYSKEIYSFLNWTNPPNIHLMFRGYFTAFNAIEMLPSNLIPKLYVKDRSSDIYIKWKPEYYGYDEDYMDLINEFFEEIEII